MKTRNISILNSTVGGSLQPKRSGAGFTLIEILVVVSLISLLSSVIAVGLTASKARAQDAARVGDVDSIKTAVFLYKRDNNGQAPRISSTPNGFGLVSDTNSDFNTTLQPLVDGRYISHLPQKPIGIFYVNQGPGADGEDVVIIGATLQTPSPSTSGISGSCRGPTGGGFDPPPPGYLGYVSCTLEGIPGYMYCSNGRFVILDIPTICNDGLDNDGDGVKDYPADPGCVSLNDNGESNATTATCSSTVPNTDYCQCI